MLSKRLPAIQCYCMQAQCLLNKWCPIRIVSNHRVFENHSIVHRWTLCIPVPDVVASNHASYHHPLVAVMHVLLRRPNQGRHECKCVHSTARPQTNPTKSFRMHTMQTRRIEKRNLFDVLSLLRLTNNIKCFDIITCPALAAIVSSIKPFGSFVRNLKEIELCLPVSHGGRI